MATIDFSQDHFTLFGLPRRYALDEAELDRLFREAQARVHPDMHAHLGEAEQRLAMQWSTRVNEAYQTLKQPIKRASYLLELAGAAIRLDQNRAMSAEFLLQQMEWREAVEEASEGGDIRALEAMHHRIKLLMAAEYEKLRVAIDEQGDHQLAAQLVRQMMFQEKLLQEIDSAIEVLETT